MVDDRRTYREFSVQQRRRRSRDAGLLNVDDDIAIDAIAVRTSVTEADDIELHRGKQLEPGLRQIRASDIPQARRFA